MGLRWVLVCNGWVDCSFFFTGFAPSMAVLHRPVTFSDRPCL